MTIAANFHDMCVGHKKMLDQCSFCVEKDPHSFQCYDSVEEDVNVVDLSVNETNIEGLDGTPNFDHVKRVIDRRDPSNSLKWGTSFFFKAKNCQKMIN